MACACSATFMVVSEGVQSGMAPQLLLHYACTRPSMYGKTFLEVAQFLNGYDAGYTAALRLSGLEVGPEFVGLSRFREWLAHRMGGEQCRFWEAIVEQTFPSDATRFEQTILLFNEFKHEEAHILPSISTS